MVLKSVLVDSFLDDLLLHCLFKFFMGIRVPNLEYFDHAHLIMIMSKLLDYVIFAQLLHFHL